MQDLLKVQNIVVKGVGVKLVIFPLLGIHLDGDTCNNGQVSRA